jgi:hypothetical protein
MSLGSLARKSGLYDLVEPVYSARLIEGWENDGRPVPAPSAVKRHILREYSRRYGLRTLVETGTYEADTVRALRNDFDVIHSIEIDERLHTAAFSRCKNQKNAHIHLGDSAEVLTRIVPTLAAPALFWLNAHFSGGQTGGDVVPPIMTELREILTAQPSHVVLIDDMREFGHDENYPTVDAIHRSATDTGYLCEVRDDIARLSPTR